MHLTLLKSKIHRATVTGASLHYEGSLTISRDLAEQVGLMAYEKILVGNMANGERFETYVIYGEAGTGQIQLNGATAEDGGVFTGSEIGAAWEGDGNDGGESDDFEGAGFHKRSPSCKHLAARGQENAGDVW